jgi:hypothetical protein
LKGDYDFREPLIANWIKGCSSLAHLSLFCNKRCKVDRFLQTLENNAKTLTSLDLQYCVISSTSILMITRVVCDTIVKLTLASLEEYPLTRDENNSYPHLDDAIVLEFAKCRMLERLEISVTFRREHTLVSWEHLWEKIVYEPQSKRLYTQNLSKSFLVTVLNSCLVNEVTFEKCSRVFDEVLLTLADCNPDLHTVSFLNCDNFSHDSAMRITSRPEITSVRIAGCADMLEDQDIRKIFCHAHKTNLKKIFVSIRHQGDVDDLLHIVEHNADLEELHASFDLFVEYNSNNSIIQVQTECRSELLEVSSNLKIDFIACKSIFV